MQLYWDSFGQAYDSGELKTITFTSKKNLKMHWDETNMLSGGE